MAPFQNLMKVFSEIYQSHMEMVEMAKRKKQVLIDGDIDELAKITQLEARWIKKMGKLEEEREAIVGQFFEDRGFVLQEFSMSDLLKLLTSSQEKAQLQEIHQKLSDAIDEVKRYNELNTQLIYQSLDYVSHTLEMLTEQPKQAFTYSKPTTKQSTMPNRGIFDQKA
ncbi:flagellar protein FlgN [Tepidibacillus sp. HK-1]|uniref:flagellar protein FlgN n=1 Tax=Tepidibacillus sp. HK-1 TaxID=1883407 RepID=UPI000853EA37|nr:flagellar protein FlgN [Tepidibacillus sp. HK-1]GBF10535.1 flgN protein [Tepidibacillus sp. HK-1]